MNPIAKARGVQLARNDKAAASDCMTAARQGRPPAAVAAADAWVHHTGWPPSVDVGHLTPTTLPAGNPPNGQCSRCG